MALESRRKLLQVCTQYFWAGLSLAPGSGKCQASRAADVDVKEDTVIFEAPCQRVGSYEGLGSLLEKCGAGCPVYFRLSDILVTCLFETVSWVRWLGRQVSGTGDLLSYSKKTGIFLLVVEDEVIKTHDYFRFQSRTFHQSGIITTEDYNYSRTCHRPLAVTPVDSSNFS